MALECLHPFINQGYTLTLNSLVFQKTCKPLICSDPQISKFVLVCCSSSNKGEWGTSVS
ncbi:hypothetical protein PL9631_940162 [Planktothrix paucivesiculata PCC 9631]|uniref:Uncharacterized protein n=1 Tax=Planktothrix paucivesiculata PCC 9631 TaxID=671071 RepID=A0A7Z9C4K6_9CYAN|nr:hypothetical protein PL9631_940162 [Planktothrix paucivesiculata PCC 9631]